MCIKGPIRVSLYYLLSACSLSGHKYLLLSKRCQTPLFSIKEPIALKEHKTVKFTNMEDIITVKLRLQRLEFNSMHVQIHMKRYYCFSVRSNDSGCYMLRLLEYINKCVIFIGRWSYQRNRVNCYYRSIIRNDNGIKASPEWNTFAFIYVWWPVLYFFWYYGLAVIYYQRLIDHSLHLAVYWSENLNIFDYIWVI